MSKQQISVAAMIMLSLLSLLALILFPVGVSAEEPGGPIGDSEVYWQFNSSGGQLVISGSGDCAVFTSAADQPWASIRTEIKEVWFENMDALAISNLAYWFDGCTNLIMSEVPYTTPVVGTRAFANCPSLECVMFYHDRDLTIVPGAFSVDELAALQVRYIPSAEEIGSVLMDYDWPADQRAVLFEDVYGVQLLAVGTCVNCKVTCAYTVEYSIYNNTWHWVRHWCSNCGKDQTGGVNSDKHTFSGLKCTLCGYTKTCTHPSTTLKWTTDCNYQYTCDTCGVAVSSGTIHTYTYGNWEYYTSSYHRRAKTCKYGDMTAEYEIATHATTKRYSSYDDNQHKEENYCSDCDSVVGTASYASHSIEYGVWTHYSSTRHRRVKSCSTCDYRTYEYNNHSLTYGEWTEYTEAKHKRTKTCSCGYSGVEYAEHSYTSAGAWANYSDSQHSRIVTCSCGRSTTEYASHSYSYGSWRSYSDSQHRRTKTCSCGYSTYSYGSHSDGDMDGYCDSCSYYMPIFSVTLPASLELSMDAEGEVYTPDETLIINQSTGDVEVTDLILESDTGWEIVPYETNMASEKVDSCLIGFWINGAETQEYGEYEYLDLSWYPEAWIVPQDDILELYYHAVVSASSREIYEQVLTAIFVVDWL